MGIFLNDHGLEEEVLKHGSHNQKTHGGKGGSGGGGGGGGLTAETVSQNKQALANMDATANKIMDKMDDDEYEDSDDGAPIDVDMHASSGIPQTTSFWENSTAESINSKDMSESYKEDMARVKTDATTFGQDAVDAGNKFEDVQLISWGKQIISNAAKIKVGD